jgi:hypothetical protein
VKCSISEGGFTQPASSRTWCGQVIGAVSGHFTEEEAKCLFLDKALSLCQDTDMEVRAVMGRQLPKLIECLESSTFHDKVMPELVELAMDEEISVREAAIEGIGSIVDHLKDDSKKTYVVPTWISMLEEKPLAKILSKECGRYLWNCKSKLSLHFVVYEIFPLTPLVFVIMYLGLLSEPELQLYKRYYSNLPNNQDVQVRNNCVYNLPGVLKCLNSDPSVLSTVDKSSNDNDASVRQKLASCFQIVSEVLHPSSYLKLKSSYFSLFADTESVFSCLLINLDKVTSIWIKDESFRKVVNLKFLCSSTIHFQYSLVTSYSSREPK